MFAYIFSGTTFWFIIRRCSTSIFRGHKIALTCKKCNNTSGHIIDNHLINFLKRLDEIDFIDGSNRRIEIIKEGRRINADLEVGSNRELNVILPRKINNPKILEEHIANTNEGDIIDIKNKKIDIDLKKVSTAILKMLISFYSQNLDILSIR